MDINSIFNGVVDNKMKKLTTEQEKIALLKAAEKIDNITMIGSKTDGNFTTAIIQANGTYFTGVAKRNPIDKPNPKRGQFLAVSRAIKNALSYNG